MTEFLWLTGFLRLLFLRYLPLYGDTAYFFHYSFFQSFCRKKCDIFYISGTRVPILHYYRFLGWLSRLFQVSPEKVEQLHHCLLFYLEIGLIFQLLLHFGMKEQALLLPLFYFLFLLPPRTFSYFGSCEIFNSLFDVIFLSVCIFWLPVAENGWSVFWLSFFALWYLASFKFLHAVKYPLFWVVFFVNYWLWAVLGGLFGLLVALYPHWRFSGIQRIIKIVRSYKSCNEKGRAHFTSLHKDFLWMHLPGFCAILMAYPLMSTEFRNFFYLLFLLDFFIIALQNNAYPYQGLPLFKYYAVACVLLPVPWSAGLLIFFLVYSLYHPLHLFPAKLYRQDSFIRVQNELGSFLLEKKVQATEGLLSFGYFVVIHVKARIPEYLDYFYAWQFMQSVELLNELYPNWEKEFREKLQNNPPRFVLIWLDEVNILNIEAISELSGCKYRLLQTFLHDKLLLFEKRTAVVTSDSEANFQEKINKKREKTGELFLQKGSVLMENIQTLSPYLQLYPKVIIVVAADLFSEASNLFPQTNFISEADFLNQKLLMDNTQYLLYTNSSQNNIVEKMANKKNGAIITKLL